MKYTSNTLLIKENPFSTIFLAYVIYMIYFSFIHGSDYGFLSGIACFFGFFLTYLGGGSIGTASTKNSFDSRWYVIAIILIVVGYFILAYSQARLELIASIEAEFQIIAWAIINVIIGIFASRESVKRKVKYGSI